MYCTRFIRAFSAIFYIILPTRQLQIGDIKLKVKESLEKMANTKIEEWVQVLGVLLFLGVVVVLIIFVVNKFIAFFNYIFSTNEPPKYFVTTRAHYTPESIQLKNGPFGYRTINVVDESSEVDDAVEQLIK